MRVKSRFDFSNTRLAAKQDSLDYSYSLTATSSASSSFIHHKPKTRCSCHPVVSETQTAFKLFVPQM